MATLAQVPFCELYDRLLMGQKYRIKIIFILPRNGGEIFSGLRAEKITPESNSGYSVSTVSVRGCCGSSGIGFQGKEWFSARTLGDSSASFKNRDVYKTLTLAKIGEDVRSMVRACRTLRFNSEQDFSTGIASGGRSSRSYTKIEGVRYPAVLI